MLVYRKKDDVPDKTAAEIIKVGIVPSPHDVGYELLLLGKTYVFTEEVTRVVFLNAVIAAGMNVHRFTGCPQDTKFFRIEEKVPAR